MRPLVRPIVGPLAVTQEEKLYGARASRLRVFNPLQLFANGEKGWWYDLADLSTQFTDFAGTVPATTSGDAVACLKDKSGNGSDAKKATATARPLLKFLPSSNRPYHDYDGVDDVLTNTVATTLTNCTQIRLFAGNVNITTGVTINAGNSNRTLDNFGEIVVNRALTAAETAAVTLWANQRRGQYDEINTAYGADTTNELLDIFPSSGHRSRLVIVMVHGGGWRNGDKLLDNVTFNKFHNWIRKGFTCVSVNYKLDVGTDPVTVQAVSVAKAIAYVQARFPGQPLLVMGHSAGAHLTNLAMSDDGIRNGAGVNLSGVIGMLLLDSAAFDVVNIMSVAHLPLYDEPWGADPQKWHDGSPALVIASRMPTTLCIVSQTGGPHGESDSENTNEYIAASSAFGTTITRRDTLLGHGELNNLLGLTPAVGDTVTDATYTADVDAWIATLIGQF